MLAYTEWCLCRAMHANGCQCSHVRKLHLGTKAHVCLHVHAQSSESQDAMRAAKHHCRAACVAIGLAFLCALMMLSKTAMNLKSHVKDDAWMRRVRRIFMKLQVRPVCRACAFMPGPPSPTSHQHACVWHHGHSCLCVVLRCLMGVLRCRVDAAEETSILYFGGGQSCSSCSTQLFAVLN